MQKRLSIVIVLAVIAALLLWPDDDEPSDEEQKSANAMIAQPQQRGRAPVQQRSTSTAPPGFSGQMPWSGGYTPRQGYQPAPADPYSQGQTAPYGGFSFRSPEESRDWAPGPGQALQFPGSVPSQYPHVAPPGGGYGYSTVPGYRFRPQEDAQKSSRRYSGGDYPSQGYPTPQALAPQGTYQPDYGAAPAQSWQAPGYGTGQLYPGATAWDQYSGR